MAQHYCNTFKIKALGLRFFTVFGEWGRPDMLIIKFLISSLNKKKFEVYNNGNHHRDFTYIKDLCNLIFPVIKNFKKIDNTNQIFNICTGKTIYLRDVLKKLINLSNYKNLTYKEFNKMEVLKTHGSNKKILNFTKKQFKHTPLDVSIKNTFDWFIKNKKIFLN